MLPLELILIAALHKPLPQKPYQTRHPYKEIYLRNDQKIAELGKNPDVVKKY